MQTNLLGECVTWTSCGNIVRQITGRVRAAWAADDGVKLLVESDDGGLYEIAATRADVVRETEQAT